MRWVIVAIAGIASAGLIAVGVSMNFAFGSSFGRTPLESYAYGAAFGFADILKVAAPIVAARELWQPQMGRRISRLGRVGNLHALFGRVRHWLCLCQPNLRRRHANRSGGPEPKPAGSLEADQSELRRLRDRLASTEVGRSERIQLTAAAQRLEAAIGASRGKLEDAAPVVSTANPQAYTLAKLTGVGIDKIEVGLVVLVALLVEMGGLGPFITMNLAKVPQTAKVPKTAKVPEGSAPEKASRRQPQELGRASTPPSPEPQRPSLIHSAVAPPAITLDLERFLDRHAHHGGGSAVGSSELLARYNRSRRERGLPEISQRRLGDAMRALGHHKKPRLADGRIHYQGLAWGSRMHAKYTRQPPKTSGPATVKPHRGTRTAPRVSEPLRPLMAT